ncbi:MAG: hypothetical protein WBG86_09115 [Polyangiales bacterium]
MPEPRRRSFIQLQVPPVVDQAMTWDAIRADSTWQGRWVALDDCAYNEAGEATAGLVVDHDDNLADLCARLSADRRKRCSIVFCPPAESAA